jgi:hypothetical protein
MAEASLDSFYFILLKAKMENAPKTKQAASRHQLGKF